MGFWNDVKSWWMSTRAKTKLGEARELAQIPVPKTWMRLKPPDELANIVLYQTDRGLVVTASYAWHEGQKWLRVTLARPGKPPTQDDMEAAKNVLFGRDRPALVFLPAEGRSVERAKTYQMIGLLEGEHSFLKLDA